MEATMIEIAQINRTEQAQNAKCRKKTLQDIKDIATQLKQEDQAETATYNQALQSTLDPALRSAFRAEYYSNKMPQEEHSFTNAAIAYADLRERGITPGKAIETLKQQNETDYQAAFKSKIDPSTIAALNAEYESFNTGMSKLEETISGSNNPDQAVLDYLKTLARLSESSQKPKETCQVILNELYNNPVGRKILGAT